MTVTSSWALYGSSGGHHLSITGVLLPDRSSLHRPYMPPRRPLIDTHPHYLHTTTSASSAVFSFSLVNKRDITRDIYAI